MFRRTFTAQTTLKKSIHFRLVNLVRTKVKKPTYGVGGDLFFAYAQDCKGMHLGAKLSVGKNMGKREKTVKELTTVTPTSAQL